MRNKFLLRLACILFAVALGLGAVSVSAQSADKVKSAYDGIIDFNLQRSGADNVQEWINSSLSSGAGKSAEWYILALSQSGSYNFTPYEAALKKYVSKNKVPSATTRQKYALCLIAVGSTDGYIASVADDSIGRQGVMSWIYGLHLLNNGCKSGITDTPSAINTLLSLQKSDGGWAVTGNYGDNDVTAMALQALSPYYNENAAVRAAADSAVSLLSSRQNADGDFSGYGVPNAESTAQVITALSALGIDGDSDSRFIKNGKTALDGLLKYRLADGSFCHKVDGGFNETATEQAFYSLIAYNRMRSGKTGFYILDNRSPHGFEAPPIQSGGVSDESQTDETNNDNASFSVSSADVNGSSEISLQPDSPETVSSKEIQTEAEKTKEDKGKTEKAKDNEKARRSGYKPWACLAIVLLGLAAAAVLYFLKKRNIKNFIAVGVAVLAGILFVLLTNFQSTDTFYGANDSGGSVGAVTLEIRCDTAVGKLDSEYIPKDGCILKETKFALEKGDTVYDILIKAAKKYGIQTDISGGRELGYVKGINYLYEFDCGDLSGWMYLVNGESPSVGCGEYTLSDGDKVEWIYTCNLGEDLK